MIVPDVNVLVNAFRADAPMHVRSAGWLDDSMNGAEPVGLADAVVAGFIRIVTNPRIYRVPVPIDTAIAFVDALFEHGAVRAAAGPRHWEIMAGLCRSVRAQGNLVSDAAIAAVVIENGASLVTLDRDFGRFPTLRWELLE